MIKIFNDIHADSNLLECILHTKINQGDLLIANGDFLGSCNTITNEIVKAFYEVKHNEASKSNLQEIFSAVLKTPIVIEDDLISQSIHSGTFLAEMCRKHDGFRAIIEDEVRHNLIELSDISKKVEEKGGKLIYLPGNGEIAISDFDATYGVDREKILPPEKRLFNRLAKDGTFLDHGVEYINHPKVVQWNTLLIPIDFLDEMIEREISIPPLEHVVNLVVHYPPSNLGIMDCFHKLFDYEPNKMDILRMNAVSEIIKRLPNLNIVVFGHIHPGISKASIEKLPKLIIFREKEYQLIWNSPGNVFAFN